MNKAATLNLPFVFESCIGQTDKLIKYLKTPQWVNLQADINAGVHLLCWHI